MEFNSVWWTSTDLDRFLWGVALLSWWISIESYWFQIILMSADWFQFHFTAFSSFEFILSDFKSFWLILIDSDWIYWGQINPGTQSRTRLGLENRWNQVISCTEWTMRVPEASVGASPGRRLDVGWLGLQREADFRKKVLPAAATALFWSMDLPWTPKGPPRDPKRIQGIPDSDWFRSILLNFNSIWLISIDFDRFQSSL